MEEGSSHVRLFYDLLGELEHRLGGKRKLSACTGRMNWPERGVYFFFEDGESRTVAGQGPRVVRVGTHALTTGSRTTLWNRLSQHRGSSKTGGGNHRGSIFRLLIGEALGNRDPMHRLDSWGKGGSATPAIRVQEVDHERRVSAYVGAMPFLWLEIPDAPGTQSARGLVERNSIALLSRWVGHQGAPPSNAWLGHFSGRENVRSSGLWNQNHVGEPYSALFLDELERRILVT